MSHDVAGFYDAMAADYHLNYADWDAGIARQGAALDAVIRHRLGRDATVLDCCCGIGTQAIGLAARGHRVHGTDISAASVDRARREAAARDVNLTVAVADMRDLPFPANSFDAVLCADNGLPHLWDMTELTRALRQFRRVLRPGGLLLGSIRDYDALRTERPDATSPRSTDGAEGRVVGFQLWHWHDDAEHYDLEHFQLTERTGRWRVDHRVSRYWALTRAQLAEAAAAAGFDDLQWHEPHAVGFFQPVFTAGC